MTPLKADKKEQNLSDKINTSFSTSIKISKELNCFDTLLPLHMRKKQVLHWLWYEKAFKTVEMKEVLKPPSVQI